MSTSLAEKTTGKQLPRRFGLLQATALNMSNMIGIGPFITIPLLMTALGGPQAMLGWLVAVVIAIADGTSIGKITVSLWIGTLITILAVILTGAMNKKNTDSDLCREVQLSFSQRYFPRPFRY